MPHQDKLRVVIIVQARMGAHRLPGKPLKQVLGVPLLGYQIERLRRVTAADAIVIATTTNPLDQPIVDFCNQEQIPFYRGSEEDVLDRYVKAAHSFAADVVVRITADCPLIDPAVVDQVITYYLDHYPDYDYVSNTLDLDSGSKDCVNLPSSIAASRSKLTYPRGMDVEVFSAKSLQEADLNGVLPEEREHVTVYIYRHPESFNLGCVTLEPNESRHRWCVDTQEDLTLITKIIEALYPVNPEFTLQDILDLLKQHPTWPLINAHVQQKKLSA